MPNVKPITVIYYTIVTKNVRCSWLMIRKGTKEAVYHPDNQIGQNGKPKYGKDKCDHVKLLIP